MKSVELIKKILTGIGITILVFLSIFVYSFMGSKISDGDPSPEAYGYDSLEYTAEPVMKINVWQRNDKTLADAPVLDLLSSYYYNMIPLELQEGYSIDTILFDESANYSRVYDPAVQIIYEGPIKGEYELKGHMFVYYSGSNDSMPNSRKAKATPDAFNNDDASFSGTDSVTVSVEDASGSYLSAKNKNHGLQTSQEALAWREEVGGFDYDDYFTTEKLTDVYDDVPDSLKKVKRYVQTTHLTVHAMDPVKQDIVVATAVLEIKSHSKWELYNLTAGEHKLFAESGFANAQYSTVTVVSYEQSDSFSME